MVAGSGAKQPDTRSHCLSESGARQCSVQMFGPQTEDTPYSFVDRPRTSFRVVSVLVWTASAFLLYKAVMEPPTESWAFWGALAIFAVCCYSVINEFMLRPTRVTTIRPVERQLVVQETALWRKKELIASIPRGACFEIALRDGDMNLYEVRIKSTNKGWVTVAEYVSKEDAARIARDANSRLFGS